MRFQLLLLALAAPASFVSAQPAVDWRVAPLTPGSWAYRGLADGSEAVFTDAGVVRRIVVKCSRPARHITVSVASPVAVSSLTIATSEAQRVMAARHDARSFQIIAQVPANDGILDAIAFGRGRFAVIVPGSATLVVPAWPDVARSIEDCRI